MRKFLYNNPWDLLFKDIRTKYANYNILYIVLNNHPNSGIWDFTMPSFYLASWWSRRILFLCQTFQCFFCTYIYLMDDILLARNNIEYLISIKERLSFNFERKNMGIVEFILNVKILNLSLMLKFSVIVQRECYLFLKSIILIKFWNGLT